jgi:hypothetical protein
MRVVGKAQWTAANGVITGTSIGGSGWLVMNESLQDISAYTQFRCEGGGEMGILLCAENTPEGGLKGTYVWLSDATLPAYSVTVGSDGSISKRDKPAVGGGLIRIAPPPSASQRPLNIQRPPKPNVLIPVEAPDTSSLRTNDWNSVEIFLDTNTIRSFLNNGPQHGATVEDGTYGPAALYVGGEGSVQFRDTVYADMSLKRCDDEKVGTDFKKQRLNDFFHSWGIAAADFNHDGVLDVVAGPFIYFGPDYRTSRKIYYAVGANPITEFSANMEYAADFTGDGWPDVIVVSFGGSSGIDLYVNPKGEKRRWEKFSVGSGVQSEIAVVRDIDGDGKPEINYSGGGHVRFAKPDPADPTGKWKYHDVSEAGYGTAHSISVGDVDGGGLSDVVTSLDAHGWGLAWFEQKHSDSRGISFVEHMVMDDFSTKNAGGVTFSEIHGTAYADVDGDGVPDFIAGKRWFSHLDTNIDPDPTGAPVLYWYRTVRTSKAPGGAELVSQLIDTHRGVGSDLVATDLNKDGGVDIVTSTRFGTFIYWGQAKHASVVPTKPAATL